MSSNQDFVQWFRGTAPYIKAHRKKTFVMLMSDEIIQSDRLTGLIHDIALLNHLGIKLVILHANDKAFCEAYRSQFAKENIKAITFTADTKEEEHHEMIINESKIDDDVQVILTTNIYNVGLSIKPGDSHAVIITHKSRLLPRDVCQVAARMRHGAEFQLPTVVLVATVCK